MVYILHSESLGRFYTGYTEKSSEERLLEHILETYGNKGFTRNAKDWKVFLEIKCQSKPQARKVEIHIKRMKNKKYLENLKLYPEMRQKLLDRYSE